MKSWILKYSVTYSVAQCTAPVPMSESSLVNDAYAAAPLLARTITKASRQNKVVIYKSWCVIVGLRGERTDTSDSGEVCRDWTIAQRKDSAALGRGGGTGTRTRWNRAGRRGDGVVATISAGLQELAAGPEEDDAAGRLRGPGAGRKALAEHDAGLVAALERLVDPATRGDPTGPLRWTCSSAARLSRALQEGGHRVSERSVNRLLHALGYSLQANRKTLEGKQHPDRDAQFNHINRRVRAFQRRRQPVVSVDTKKRSSSARSKTRGGSGVLAVTRRRFGSTTFRTRSSARRFRTACTI